jgi:hypothetical protein
LSRAWRKNTATKLPHQQQEEEEEEEEQEEEEG